MLSKKPKTTNVTLAMVGMPNVGKSTLFNKLTGNNQQVGNWPGVTVHKYSGYLRLNNCEQIEIIDLPGCYSLISSQDMPLDEKLATDFILTNPDTVLINVVDATTLHKDLYLSLQLLEQKSKVILVLNKTDLAKKMGLCINIELLQQNLGCKIVAVSSKSSAGIDNLIAQISTYVAGKYSINAAIVPDNNLSDVAQAVVRHKFIAKLLQAVILKENKSWNEDGLSAKLDFFMLNRFLGIPIFLVIMYLMFVFTINVGGILQAYADMGMQLILFDFASNFLLKINTPTWLQTMLVEGLGQGISITLSFAPSLFCLFLFLSFLEGSGYISRAAFVMDRLMRWLGLPGKAFVPMIVGFGCNVPGVMSTRTLDSHKERILTILMLPFMSCGARLAIYVVFVAAFFKNSGHNIIFLLYLFGITVAILTGMLMGSTILKNSNSALIMELPRYELPAALMLFRQAWFKLKNFLFKAGYIIVPLCIILSSLNYYTTAHSSFTFLEAMGKQLTPLFAPMGLQADNWPATVGLLTGVMAKEVVIGTLSSLYIQISGLNTGANIVGLIGSKFADKASALAYLVFVLLYTPCISVLAAIAKEVNRRWSIFCVLWTTSVAYSSAVVCYQALTFMQHPIESSLWILGSISILALFVWILKLSAKINNISYKKLPTAIIVS